MQPLYLNQQEAEDAVKGRLRKLYRPVKWPVKSRSDGFKARIYRPSEVDEMNGYLRERQSHPHKRVCPYGQVDSVLFLREAWSLHGDGDVDLKVSWPMASHLDEPEPKWRSAITMPKEFVRFRPTLVSVSVVDVVKHLDTIWWARRFPKYESAPWAWELRLSWGPPKGGSWGPPKGGS